VPSTRTPRYELAAGIRCVPPNALVHVAAPPSAYVVIGAGKTAIDTCLWLLERGVDPGLICWIKPREPWLANRVRFQPSELIRETLEGLALQMEAVAKSETVDEVFAQLNAAGVLLCIDESVTPSAYRCATVTEGELAELRRIERVVRLGWVQRIDIDRIVLDHGSIPTDATALHIDCTASGISKREKLLVFGEKKIVLQSVRICQPAFSAALIGHVEATYGDSSTKNQICPAIPYPERPLDWLSMTLAGVMTEYQWSRDKALRSWLQGCRLNVYRGMADLAKTDAEAAELMQRFRNNVFPATMKLEQLLSEPEYASSGSKNHV
jgi:hypothetical protein